MSDSSEPRPSELALLPRDVTDRLLWRLAVDVATAHQFGSDNRCVNLQCVNQSGPCVAARLAQRAMRLSRTPLPQPQRLPQPAAPRRSPQRPGRDSGGFVGWFTARITATAAHLRERMPQRLPRRVPGATLTAYAA